MALLTNSVFPSSPSGDISPLLRGEGRRAWQRISLLPADRCALVIDSPTSGRVAALSLEDLSMGGAGALMPSRARLPVAGEPVQIELRLGSNLLQLWGALAWSRPSARGRRLGLFFRQGPVYQAASIPLASFLTECLRRRPAQPCLSSLPPTR
jgi:hypothetical protein